MNDKTRMALHFAIEAHRGQKRKNSNNNYIVHPIGVYKILEAVTTDENVLCAALLHDVIEDTKFTYEDIKEQFGQEIADIVMEVTKDEKGNFNIKTKEGLMIKCADIIHNIHDGNDLGYLQRKLAWVENRRVK